MKVSQESNQVWVYRVGVGLVSGWALIFSNAAVLAQSYTFSPVPTLPPGEGWRSVTPQSAPQQPYQPPTQFNLQATLLLRSGDILPATYRAGDPLYIAPGETRSVTLVLDTALRDPQGNQVVPAGSLVEGQFQPVNGGTQFFARSVIINNQSYPLFAQSAVIANQKDPRQTSGQAIAEDVAIGAAAGAILGGLLGNQVISTEKVIGGALAGAVVGNVTAPEVAVVNADTPLTLTVTQDFQPVIR
ncbi:MAG: hypothetical protein NW237_13505 [Cyanobacteriota bacterium]|nr:hypothetical protein [Cyanobacteriota bacterium]